MKIVDDETFLLGSGGALICEADGYESRATYGSFSWDGSLY